MEKNEISIVLYILVTAKYEQSHFDQMILYISFEPIIMSSNVELIIS